MPNGDKQLLVYDDGRGRFGPLTDLRNAFELRYSSQLPIVRIERVLQHCAAALWSQPRLASLTRLRYPSRSVNTLPEKGDWLLVNGRWPALSTEQIDAVRNLVPGESLVDQHGITIAAHLSAADAARFIESGFVEVPDTNAQSIADKLALLDRPWQMFELLEALLIADLLASDLPPIHPGDHPGVTVFGRYPVRVAPGAEIMPSVVIDSGNGPVVIEKGATINALTILQGPCYIGAHSVMVAHASVRRSSIVGPHCKIGGEIAFCAFHSYTNKVHSGFVGNCLISPWCNFGAATNVSNLKNTYGYVRMQLEEDREPENTGRRFQGPIFGDYVRTAIGSRLNTGSVFGTGSMLALSTISPKFCQRFSFHSDAGCETYDLDKFLETARIMMARRDMNMSNAEEEALRSLHEQCT